MAQQQSWGTYRLPKGLIADLPNTLEIAKACNGLVAGRLMAHDRLLLQQFRHGIQSDPILVSFIAKHSQEILPAHKAV